MMSVIVFQVSVSSFMTYSKYLLPCFFITRSWDYVWHGVLFFLIFPSKINCLSDKDKGYKSGVIRIIHIGLTCTS